MNVLLQIETSTVQTNLFVEWSWLTRGWTIQKELSAPFQLIYLEIAIQALITISESNKEPGEAIRTTTSEPLKGKYHGDFDLTGSKLCYNTFT